MMPKFQQGNSLQILDSSRLYVLENGVPEKDHAKADLETKHIDEVETFDSYTVTVTDNTYKLIGVGEKGGIKITFKGCYKKSD